MKYPAIKPVALTGAEPINGTSFTLRDYWSWAHSNIVDNAERGAFAEYLVKCAIGADTPTRVNWDAYDLLSPEGIKVEVKASGYLQSWAQEKLSAIQFSIAPAYGWDAATNTYDEKLRRQSDVYVFCLLKHTDQETLNPLDTDQWEFYVVKTALLNEKCTNQKTISLSALKKLGAAAIPFEEIRAAVLQAGIIGEDDQK